MVHNQEFLSSSLENSESNEFKTLSSMMKQKIDRLFRESALSRSYIKCEIIAFERRRNTQSDVIIHFNVYVSSSRQSIESSDIYLVLAEEILNNRLKAFDNLMIDHSSIDVQERKWVSGEKAAFLINPWTYRSIFPGMLEGLSTEPTPPPRKCDRIGLNYCQFLSYNRTSYPNFFSHWNLSSVEEEFVLYKELIDSECYYLAKEFVCNLLQPECVNDEMVLPCKEFCDEFYTACQRWLPERLASKLSCSGFPDHRVRIKDGWYPCRRKPDCAASLRLRGQGHKVCDGVRDCDDHSDEASCPYCDLAGGQFHCGTRQCVPQSATCDGVKDCNNGADEANCLLLSAGREGYLRATFKGKLSYVCSSGNDVSSPAFVNQSRTYFNNQMQILGVNICNENHFE